MVYKISKKRTFFYIQRLVFLINLELVFIVTNAWNVETGIPEVFFQGIIPWYSLPPWVTSKLLEELVRF